MTISSPISSLLQSQQSWKCQDTEFRAPGRLLPPSHTPSPSSLAHSRSFYPLSCKGKVIVSTSQQCLNTHENPPHKMQHIVGMINTAGFPCVSSTHYRMDLWVRQCNWISSNHHSCPAKQTGISFPKRWALCILPTPSSILRVSWLLLTFPRRVHW